MDKLKTISDLEKVYIYAMENELYLLPYSVIVGETKTKEEAGKHVKNIENIIGYKIY